ncbi:SAM-dependent methyltransferase [Phytohabitans sp. ZYX-F-186]|uniref:SAM-dependent methyltransferase n=1 Tax=Phytohabitans maris TaxID=3071409 RepID=A0ABU0ZC60_9ACTN|nr:SAM-dependent methyltransferase [Phytohabitans sp. ZYX-F-186]MDQ7904661.1 SAM-dependent methyltransferase [Phytohabitans sp. ZYX-F-186]
MEARDEDGPRVKLRTDVAHGARIYDYILGGKDNYAVDREAGENSLRIWPALRVHMQANRFFMHRVARFLAAECGIRQFLDIGTGLPTSPNLHEVVQSVDPTAHVVYTDNDPLVLVHARALLVGTAMGRTAYVDADMRDPQAIISAPEFLETIDLNQPVGLLLIAVVHFIEDDAEALRVVRQILDVLPTGSYLAMSIATDEFDPIPLAEVQQEYNRLGETLIFRDRATTLSFFDGVELVEPGLVQVHKWRPDGSEPPGIADKDIAMYGAVARKA